MINFVPYPFWIKVDPNQGNPANPITSSFAGADMFWPNPLELKAPTGVTTQPLFVTSHKAWLETKNLSVDPNASFMFNAEKKDTTKSYTLAAALSGKFPSYYKGKPKPTRTGSTVTLPDLPKEAKESRLIVVGDVDFATTQMLQNTGDQRNLDFLVKAADWLSNDDDIIAIRNRPAEAGRLDKIANPDKRFMQAAWARIIGIGLVPFVVLLAAIIVIAARKQRQKAFMNAHAMDEAPAAAAKKETEAEND
jgi:ABC-type uncharacterized transport system involved in gliding motility auxiliary subunit